MTIASPKPVKVPVRVIEPDAVEFLSPRVPMSP
jgi:hypothetical protein